MIQNQWKSDVEYEVVFSLRSVDPVFPFFFFSSKSQDLVKCLWSEDLVRFVLVLVLFVFRLVAVWVAFITSIESLDPSFPPLEFGVV